MSATAPDQVDTLAGIAPGDALDALRTRRPLSRAHAEASHRALFHPAEPGAVSAADRFALGAYVAGLHRAEALQSIFLAELASPALARAVADAIAATLAEGPYGRYPAGPLTREDAEGPRFAVPDAIADALGPRLLAAFAHAHGLLFHPRDGDAAALQRVAAAGWSADGIVTLSQIVAFLTYQIRLVAGLRALAATA